MGQSPCDLCPGGGSSTHQPSLDPGCLFSDLVCADNELCFNDEVIGRCISASSPEEQLSRWFPYSVGPTARELLAAELTRVFGLGYSWPDIYTQCVFQTLLHDLQTGQSYSEHQCDKLRSVQRLFPVEEEEEEEQEENDNIPDNIIEDREGNIYIPEEELEYMEEPSEDNGEVTQTELGDLYGLSDNGPMEDESEEREIAPKNHDSAWWQLRQALQGLHPTQDHEPDYDEEEPQQDQELIFLPPDSMYLTREDDRDYIQPLFIPSSSILDYAFQPVGAEYNVPDLFQHVYKTPLQNFERFDETDADSQEPSEEDDHATEDEDTEEEEDDEERDPGL